MERVLHGAGAVAALSDELERCGVSRAVVVGSATLARETRLISELELAISSSRVATFTHLSQHTPEAEVEELARLLVELRADGVVSVGGGSVIDGSKGALNSVGPGLATHLAIPTTLSGAEFTASAGITEPGTRQKRSIVDRQSAPRVVILDPQMTLTTPSRLWLGSGIRAIDHAVETVWAPSPDPLSSYLALEALRRLRTALPWCHREPENLAARHQAQIAAWWAALGLASVPMGPSHALGKLLGAPFGIPHGITSCTLLPAVIRQFARTEPERVARLTGAFEVDGPDKVADSCQALIAGLGLPTALSQAGLSSEDLHRYLETVPAAWREVVRAAY